MVSVIEGARLSRNLLYTSISGMDFTSRLIMMLEASAAGGNKMGWFACWLAHGDGRSERVSELLSCQIRWLLKLHQRRGN